MYFQFPLKVFFALIFTLLSNSVLFSFKSFKAVEEFNMPIDPLLGERVDLKTDWVGLERVPRDIAILVLAGHADSQGPEGAGTPGEAVDLYSAKPMKLSIRDELFWNLLVSQAVVKIGRERDLNVSYYDPKVRNIANENDPRTNWSKGYIHSKNGGYPIEIHFDSYGKYGYGSGLIPSLSGKLNTIDESLGRRFGRYPRTFRGGLGGPKRGIRILEIGKLEGQLEAKLRDPQTRNDTIDLIAYEIINAIETGISK